MEWSGIKFGKDYKYPAWAEAVGWLLAFSSMICIPIGIAIAAYKANKTISYSPGDEIPRWRQVL